MAAALIGCAASPLHYSAVFNDPDGLGPGDPVTRSGETIGSVTSVSPFATGETQVSVKVDDRYANYARSDSILILEGANTSPSLELMSPDPSSPRLGDGAELYGASNQSQAQLLLSSLGPPTFARKYAELFGQLSSPQPSPSPGATTLQNQLIDIMRQTLAAAAAASGSTPTGQVQMEQFREDADAVERQLEAHGRTAEAAQLRAEVAQMNAATGAVGATSNTLTVPRATSTP